MTTLLAAQGDGWSVVGSDSLISDSAGRSISLSEETPKIITHNEYIIGAAGDVRAINILSHVFCPPKLRGIKRRSDIDKFITSVFIPELRECFEQQGYASREPKEQASNSSVIIVSVRGVIYEIDEDYSWSRNVLGIYAAGSGCDFATGALVALLRNRNVDSLQPEKVNQMVRKSIEIAKMFDSFSGGDVVVVQQNA